MVISGLVITLAAADEPAEGLLRTVREHPGLTLGERSGARLSLVLEADDETESGDLHDRLSRLPGVAFVDVAFVAFEDAEPPGINPSLNHHPTRSTAR